MTGGLTHTPRYKIILGFLFLYLFYQLPEAVMHYTGHVFVFLILMLLFLTVAHWVARWQGVRHIFAFGLHRNKSISKEIVTGFGVGAILALAAFVIAVVMGKETIVTKPTAIHLFLQFLLIVAGTIAPSLAEDILTRGYIYRYWPKKVPRILFLIVSPVIYVLNHTYRLGDGAPVLIFLAVVGIALAVPLLLTRCLWYTVGMHWAINVIYRITNDTFHTTANNNTALYILTLCIALSIPINYYIIKKMRLIQSDPK